MNDRFKVNAIAADFIEYFRARGHEVVPSAPLLPADPTLLFTAAGMVPFKAFYSDPVRAPFLRAASVQKCLRAGGKQSDLENVGRTLRHHTFFEMLGNFSFGDYFKKEAIEWGWELSVDVWHLDPERIWISIFEDDDEAFDLWHHHIGFPDTRIVRLGRKDNFWGPVGDTGVCGPSSEMHYDTGREGPDGGPGCAESDRYIEYWNLVFPQFFYTAAGTYDDLPRPGIDTGLGLERIAFILQGVRDNFHTDEFLPIRDAIERALPAASDRDKAALAVNAAADHVRALTFAFAEGITPSNEGRGYVLRRLLRRALTKMHAFGVRRPFLAAAVDAVVASMKARYPDLEGRASVVREMITAEEERFLSTLEQGMAKFATLLDDARKSQRTVLGGADVFQLYDTFGFPPELTTELAADAGLAIDHEGYERAMGEQKQRARRAGFHSSGAGAPEEEFVALEPDTSASEFVGYNELECKGRVVAVRPSSAQRAEHLRSKKNVLVEFSTDQTVFYPEGGGQVGDRGRAQFGDLQLDVVDTYRVGDRIAHVTVWDKGVDPRERFAATREGMLHVDRERRIATARNHTATHLLHAALREVLGDHVAQAGSLVAPDRLRFDFHHFQAMKPNELREVERKVNEAVLADLPVTTRVVPYRDAVARGAMALFGEKYGDTVRMVEIEDVSLELCGGTHTTRTGQIGMILVRQEIAVGAGVRRVEALTGGGAIEYVNAILSERHHVASLLRVSSDDVERRVRQLVEETTTLQRRLRDTTRRAARVGATEAVGEATDIGGIKFSAVTVDAADVATLRSLGDEIRTRIDPGVALVCQGNSERPVCLVVVSDRAQREHGITAREIVGRVRDQLGWRGGGKNHMAQMGLPDKQDFGVLRDFVKGELERREQA